MATPINEHTLPVLEDALEERGWRRMVRNRELSQGPDNWEFTASGRPWEWNVKGERDEIAYATLVWFSDEVAPPHSWPASSSSRSGHVPVPEGVTSTIRIDYAHDYTNIRGFKFPDQDSYEARVQPDSTVESILEWAGIAQTAVEEINASKIPYDPKVPRGMHMPDGLSASGKKAWRALVKFLVEHELTYTGGSTMFFNPEEWAERGNEYAPGSELVVLYEGADAKQAMSLDGGDYELNDQMQEMLHGLGFTFQEGTSYYGGVFLDRARRRYRVRSGPSPVRPEAGG